MAARQASSRRAGTKAVLTEQAQPSKAGMDRSWGGPCARSRRRRCTTRPGRPRTSTAPSGPSIRTGRAESRC
eukprot:5142769-Alexandrium_andersonii.AAC.1